MKNPVSPFRRAAFSLIEITIALGVTSFAIIAMLGLLPVGLSSINASKKEYIVSQIKQEVASDLAILPFGANPPTSYFDYDGMPAQSAGAFYTVTFPASEKSSFPGSSNSTSMSNSIRDVKLLISTTSDPASDSITNTVFQLNSGR